MAFIRCGLAGLVALIACTTLAGAAEKPIFLNSDFDIVPGKVFELAFANIGAEGANVDLLSLEAGPTAATEVQRLLSAVEGDKANIVLSKDFTPGEYALKITDIASGDYDYSAAFNLGRSDGGKDGGKAQSKPAPSPTQAPPGEESGGLKTKKGANGAQKTPEITESPSPDPMTDDRLSLAAEAGICAGAAIGGTLLVSVIVLFMIRRRRAHKAKLLEESARSSSHHLPGELGGKQLEAELDSVNAQEVPDEKGWVFNNASELPSPRKEDGSSASEWNSEIQRSELSAV